MKKTLSGAVATVVAAVTLTLLSGAPAQADGPLRVLVTGDSITQGYHGDYSWRYRLAQEFDRQGQPVDFVGPTSHPFIWDGYARSSYAVPFDSDHFARVGAWLSGQAKQIGGQVAAHQPDVVVLASGINDLRYDTPPTVLARETFPRWVAAVRSAKPDTRIVVSPVLAGDRSTHPETPAEAATYNRILREEVVPSLTTPDSPITMAETDTGFDPVAYTIDGLHLNPTGESFVGSAVAAHLHGIGILPAAPAAFAHLRWTRVVKPAVRVSGNRLYVRWDGQATSYAQVYWRDGRGSFYRNFRGDSAALSAYGKTTVRVRLVRARAVGLWGSPTVVRTRPAAVSRVTVRRHRVVWTHGAGATSYRVKYLRAGRWVVRNTRHVHALRVSRVRVAYVWSVNTAGLSAARGDRR